ncbi:MAG: hypothetical protein GX117_10860, partial [Candidatus Hydrogenedentes bacterium]|nr:hypothetical protein [Candidatus Hydrogenedentota bacterium]
MLNAMSLSTSIENNDLPSSPTTEATLLRVKDLSVICQTDQGAARAVEHTSYEIKTGTTLAMVGESGCGKIVS